MAARVPLDQPLSVQNAVADLNDEILRLRKALAASVTDLRNATLPVEALQKDVAFLKQLKRIPQSGQRAETGNTPYYLDENLNWSDPVLTAGSKFYRVFLLMGA